MLEDYAWMTKERMGQAMACINNLVSGILLGRLMFRYLPRARRFFAARFAEALALISLGSPVVHAYNGFILIVWI